MRVREAITLAVNRERIMTRSCWRARRRLPSTPRFAVGWMACEVEPFVHDPERRRVALLDEAGWRDEDGDGVREAHGVEGVEDGTPI